MDKFKKATKMFLKFFDDNLFLILALVSLGCGIGTLATGEPLWVTGIFTAYSLMLCVQHDIFKVTDRLCEIEKLIKERDK